jgi:hypothetical protein
MLHPLLACNALRIGACVGRIPSRRTSASKNCVITRDTRRTLKHVQFSTEVISNCFFIRYEVYIHIYARSVNPLCESVSDSQNNHPSNLDGHAQKGCGNGRDVLVWAFVLAGEQDFQLAL